MNLPFVAERSLAILLLVVGAANAHARGKPKKRAFVYVGFGQATSGALQASLCRMLPQLATEHNLYLPISANCSADDKFNKACPNLFKDFAVGLRHLEEQHAIPADEVETYSGSNRLRCEGSLNGAVEDVRHWATQLAGQGKEVIMASEYLGALSLHQMSYLLDVFKDFELHVLILVSNPVDYWIKKFVARKRWGTSQNLSKAFGYMHKHTAKELGMERLFDAVNFYSKVAPGHVYIASLEGMERSNLGPQEVFVGDFLGLKDKDSLLLGKETGFSKALTTSAIQPNTFEMVGLASEFLTSIYRHELPKFPSETVMPVVDEGVKKLIKVLGKSWKCSDLASQFKDVINDFGKNLRWLSNVNLLYFDVDLAEDEAEYYHLDLQLCHADKESLKADEQKMYDFLVELNKFWLDWKLKTE